MKISLLISLLFSTTFSFAQSVTLKDFDTIVMKQDRMKTLGWDVNIFCKSKIPYYSFSGPAPDKNGNIREDAVTFRNNETKEIMEISIREIDTIKNIISIKIRYNAPKNIILKMEKDFKKNGYKYIKKAGIHYDKNEHFENGDLNSYYIKKDSKNRKKYDRINLRDNRRYSHYFEQPEIIFKTYKKLDFGISLNAPSKGIFFVENTMVNAPKSEIEIHTKTADSIYNNYGPATDKLFVGRTNARQFKFNINNKTYLIDITKFKKRTAMIFFTGTKTNGKDKPIIVYNPSEYLSTIKSVMNITPAIDIVAKEKIYANFIDSILKNAKTPDSLYTSKLINNANTAHYPFLKNEVCNCKKISFQLFTDSTFTNTIDNSYTHKYNERHQLVESHSQTFGIKTKTIYDINSFGLLESIHSEPTYGKIQKFIYEKDKYYSIGIENNIPIDIETYYLNDKMQCYRSTSLRADKSLVWDIFYEYDEAGRLIKTKRNDANSETNFAYNNQKDKDYCTFSIYKINPRQLISQTTSNTNGNITTTVTTDAFGNQTDKSKIIKMSCDSRIYSFDTNGKISYVGVQKCDTTNSYGKAIIPLKPTENKYTIITKDSLGVNYKGLITQNGEIILPCEYSYINIRNNREFILLQKGKKTYFYFPKTRNWIEKDFIPIETSTFSNTTMIRAFMKSDFKDSFWQFTKEELIPYHKNLDGHLAHIIASDTLKSYAGLFRNNGEEILPVFQAYVGETSLKGYKLVITNGYKSFGIIDSLGNWTIKPYYQRASILSDYPLIKLLDTIDGDKNSNHYFVDFKGNIVIPKKLNADYIRKGMFYSYIRKRKFHLFFSKSEPEFFFRKIKYQLFYNKRKNKFDFKKIK